MLVRIARQDVANVSAWKAVCVGVFLDGEALTHEVYGANRYRDARAQVERIRRKGGDACARWLNVGPWCAELWVADLSRPYGVQPELFYGPLEIWKAEVAA